MRIIGGKWRGRALAELGEGDIASHLRPTSDRSRETLFNMLSHPRYAGTPTGKRVLDVFAGTGALGLEALSRGASHASFIENGATSLTILKQNILSLGADQTRVLTSDVTKIDACKSDPFDLIFMDPPYNKSLGEQAIKKLIMHNWICAGAIIVWEDEVRPAAPALLKLLDQRKIGRAILSFYQMKKGD